MNWLIHGILGLGTGIVLDRIVIPSAFDAPTWVETDPAKAQSLSMVLQREGIDHKMTNESGPGQVYVIMTKASDRSRARAAISAALRPKFGPTPVPF